MSVDKNELHKIVDQLSETDSTSAYDFMLYLISRKKSRTWADIAKLPPDTEPLSEEEKRQLDAPEEYITLEEAKREYKL